MTQLIYLRKRLKDAIHAHEAVKDERTVRQGELAQQDGVEALGYSVSEGQTSDIVLDFPTPRGTESYSAYHANQVEIRPGAWRKMLRYCPSACSDRNRGQRAHRAEIHAALIAQGEDHQSGRLLPSLVNERKFAEDRAHLDGLDQQIEQTWESLVTAKRAYEEVRLPIVQRRRTTQMRRELLNKLVELGVEVENLPANVSVADLEELLRRKRAEIQRRNVLDELTQLGVDVTRLAPDLPSEDLNRLVRRRRRQTEPLRMSRVMRMNGIDPENLPAGVERRKVIDLLEVDGYLATVPTNLTTNERHDDLLRRGKALAAWAYEHYPSYVSEEPCYESPGRVKLVFRRPSRVERPRVRSRRRSRRREDRAWLAANLPWKQFGF